jgi:uncharacterized repeat protein (TIGR01451 family)
MCKLKLGKIGLSAPLGAAAIFGLLAVVVPTDQAQAQCGPGVGAVTVISTGPAHLLPVRLVIGDVLDIRSVNVGNQQNSLATTEADMHLIFPDNTENDVATGIELPAGLVCGGGAANFACGPAAVISGGASGTCLLFPTSYIVDPSGIGKALSFSDTHGTFTISASSPANAYHVQFMEVASGLALNPDGSIFQGSAASAAPVQAFQVITPAIAITKECDTACTPYGQPIFFHGTVSNIGDSPLHNVTVTDTPPPGSTDVSAITFDGGLVNGSFDLAAGASAVYHGHYTPPNTGGTSACGPFTDTVEASATDDASPISHTVHSTDAYYTTANGIDYVLHDARAPVTATCHVQTSPSITLTKDCNPKTVTVGETYVDTFVVCNNGNVPLSGVVINNTVHGVTTPIPVGDLAPGQCVTINTDPIPTTAADCPSVTDSAVATGNNICPPDEACPAPPTVSSAPATCTVEVRCLPHCSVTKLVACLLPSGCGTFGPSATGVKDGACPAFCYRVTIVNTDPSVTITSLSVSDPLLGGDISSFFTVPLAPGASASHDFPAITLCNDTHNTVTVTCSAPGGTDTHTASADVVVKQINIECSVALDGGEFDMDNNPSDNHVTLPTGSASTPVGVTLTLKNTGTADLIVTSVSGLPSLVDCTDDITAVDPAVVLGLPLSIPAGQSVSTLLGCWLVSCPGSSFTAIANAEADSANGTLCVYDSTGKIITDASPGCPADVTCQVPSTCRTTGGGTLYNGDVDQSCQKVTTTLFPLTSNGTATGKPLDHVSHGGQLGAPYAVELCPVTVADLGNPCIRGQWQHTRHYVGKGNPRDVIDMDFHSNTPKGVYDLHLCACLGCCNPVTGEFIPPVSVNNLCNPDDHKMCGPQPRPAPDNAIIFSGIGTIKPEIDGTTPSNKDAEYVVFRVYIEDRSEPGGFHPKGAVEPADVYSFQAWKTGIKVSKKPDFTTVATDLRLAVAQQGCAFINGLAADKTGALIGTLPSNVVTVGGLNKTADINDQGALRDGNRQIHPSTAAACTQ